METAHIRNSDAIGSFEAAQLLGVSHGTLRNRIADGSIVPLIKLPGRTGAYVFERSTVEAFAKTLAGHLNEVAG